ncbi:GrpB protein [compost metagenome]
MKKNKIGLKNDYVELVVNSKDWCGLYSTEEKKITKQLSDKILQIEHIGSTSIKKIKAKPIIDILVVVEDGFIEDEITSQLEKIGYEKGLFQRQGEIFYLKSKDDIHYYYIHLVSKSNDWERYILFRDCLNSNIVIAKKYEKLKLDLAEQFSDNRSKYTSSKENFVEKTLLKLRKR